MKMQLSLIIVGILVMFSTCAKGKECVTFKSHDVEVCLSFNNIRVLRTGIHIEKNTCVGQSIPCFIRPEFHGFNDRRKLLEAGMKPGVPQWTDDGRCVMLKEEKLVYRHRYQGSPLTHVPCPDDHRAATACTWVDSATKLLWDQINEETNRSERRVTGVTLPSILSRDLNNIDMTEDRDEETVSDSGNSEFGIMLSVTLFLSTVFLIFGCARLAVYCCRRTNSTVAVRSIHVIAVKSNPGATTGANQSETRAPYERLMEETPVHDKA